MKKGQAGTVIGIVAPLIVGVIALSIIFSQITDQTGTIAVSDDAFTAANDTCVQVTDSCILAGSSTVENSTNGVDMSGNFTECEFTSGELNGLQLNASKGHPNLDRALNASYTELSCSYITSGLSRLVLNNISVLFAIALLVFVAGFIAIRR